MSNNLKGENSMSNKNLNKGNFRFIFGDQDDRFILSSIVSVTLPSVTTTASIIPAQYGYDIKRTQGNALEFSEITLEFLVDEKLLNYFYFFDWMKKGNDFETGLAETKIKQGVLEILDQDGKLRKSIEFHNLQPLSLTAITFESNSTQTTYEQASMELTFDYFLPKKS